MYIIICNVNCLSIMSVAELDLSDYNVQFTFN